MLRMLATMRGVIAAAALVLMTAVCAFAADRITLKDGTVLEGTIAKETDTYFFLIQEIGSIRHEKLYFWDDVAKVEREGDAKPDQQKEEARPSQQRSVMPGARERRELPDGATRIAFLRLGDSNLGRDMVGPFLNGKAMQESARLLRELPPEEKPSIVVLHIDSGGGAVAELEDIMTAINDDLKEDFRVVGWIDFAISGASFTAMNCEELIFMREGVLGGNVAFNGGTGQSIQGLGLQQMLSIGEEVSAAGKHNPFIMRAMQVFGTLSCDIDEHGRVTYYWAEPGDTISRRGQHIISAEREILTLTSLDAEKFKISIGTADTKDEVAKILGISEWVEVGQRADEYQTDFRNSVGEAQVRLRELLTRLQIAMDFAASARTAQERGAKVGQARNHLREMRSLVRRAPSLVKYSFLAGFPPGTLTDEWFREIDEQLREYAADSRRR